MNSIAYESLLGWSLVGLLVIIGLGLIAIGGMIGYCYGFKTANNF